MDRSTIENLYEVLEDDGISVNTMSICNRKENEGATLQAYSEIFTSCYMIPLFENQNMLICSKKANWTWDQQRESFRENLQITIDIFKFQGLHLLLNH